MESIQDKLLRQHIELGLTCKSKNCLALRTHQVRRDLKAVKHFKVRKDKTGKVVSRELITVDHPIEAHPDGFCWFHLSLLSAGGGEEDEETH